MRLLLVEDNADLADAIVRRMRRSGHAVDWQSDGLGAASVLRYQSFDLVVLDIGLPGMDGLRVLAGLRERGDTTPVLMLTARDGIEDRVQALDVGADDYLGKPFDFREFEARCRVLLRRNRGNASEVVQLGGFAFDNAAHTVSLDGAPIELPNREYRLLEILIGRIGQVVGKDEIGNGLFGFDDEAGPNAIELYVGRLRKKLVGAPLRIVTVRGVGYKLEAAEVEASPAPPQDAGGDG
ncbi:DNA-binding response regulator [Xanthomonas sp. SS]|uniref:response regulator transcription factor n=1 Tax=Xanthomonas sp. SS TaxID=2724122 RepID=UPI0016398776|nr:response regulator transcription factor [Xanthomonas sp. SS]QNH15677.1 DNA-binding response regulator [Xanthomonas sp. SS]